MDSKKALVVISFGSTFDETRTHDIGGIEQALAAAFPAYDQFRAFTSVCILKRLVVLCIKIDDRETVLHKFADAGYEEVVLQPTHLLHGEEFEQKILSLKDKFTAKFQKIIISQPLIVNEEDYKLAAAAIAVQVPPLAADEGVVLMGHGTPRSNNKAHGNTYVKLQEIFDSMKFHVIVGNVEEDNTPKFESVLEKLQERKYKHVHMYPLMVVAGDHAINDMYSDEEDSWKTQIEALGIKTTGHLCGLGRSKAIQAIYIQHVVRVLSLED